MKNVKMLYKLTGRPGCLTNYKVGHEGTVRSWYTYLHYALHYNLVNAWYGIYSVWLRIVHQTVRPSWMSHLTNCPPNRFTTQRIDPGGQTVLGTERPPWDGIKCSPTGSKNKRLTPCAIHACKFGPFPAETIKMAGAQAVGRPNTGSNSAAGAY